MRKKVYISGPLTTGTCRAKTNVLVAILAARQLIEAGYAPLCPHLTWYIDPSAKIPHETWMEIDLPWVEAADVVLRLPGKSSGADIECEHARACGVPVVFTLTELKEKCDEIS